MQVASGKCFQEGEIVKTIQEIIRQIHAASCRAVIAVTGGGSLAISDLLCVPGASNTVLEAVVPYSPEAMTEFLGFEPKQFCSVLTAREMALAAFRKANALADEEAATPGAGIGCTASLTSDRPKKGTHRAYVAVKTDRRLEWATLELVKGRRGRAEEERVVANLIVARLAVASGVADPLSLELAPEERVWLTRVGDVDNVGDVVSGAIDATCIGGPPWDDRRLSPRVVFPGAFNPLHEGHRNMAAEASRMLQAHVEYEVSIVNVDKPPLERAVVEQRLAQFSPDTPLWITRAATFVEKAQLFPRATFVVGADTIARIADPKYCGGDEVACRNAIGEIARHGCRFLVFGRVGQSVFDTLTSLALPDPLREICAGVPESRFRLDLSSTELREKSRFNPLDN